MSRDAYDYRYTADARAHELRIIWQCNSCGATREEEPGCNEVGLCHRCCQGIMFEVGESSIQIVSQEKGTVRDAPNKTR